MLQLNDILEQWKSDSLIEMPLDESSQKTPKLHSKYLEHTAWDEWSGGDWKTIQSLWYAIPKHDLINKPIIRVTDIQGYGE